MACRTYFSKNNIDPGSDPETIHTHINNDAYNCILANQSHCGSVCENLTKTPEECIRCLSNKITCPGSNKDDACCPLAGLAIQCSNCAAQHDNLYTSCLTDTGLSTAALIGIIVGSVVGVILVVGAIVWAVKYSKSVQQRQVLADDLRQMGNQDLAQQVETIDFSQIDPSVFKEVDARLLLQPK